MGRSKKGRTDAYPISLKLKLKGWIPDSGIWQVLDTCIHVYTYGKHIICIIYGYILILYGLVGSNWPLIPFKYFLIGRKPILYMIKVIASWGVEQRIETGPKFF